MINQPHQPYRAPTLRLGSMDSPIRRPIATFGQIANWAECENLTALEQENAHRACPAIAPSALAPMAQLPWLARAPASAGPFDSMNSEMQSPGEATFLITQAQLAPIQRSLYCPMYRVINPQDILVAHPKFPHCGHFVLAQGYPSPRPNESSEAYERRTWRHNMDAHLRTQQVITIQGTETRLACTWLHDKGVLTTDNEGLQIFHPHLFTAGAPLFTPQEEAQLAHGQANISRGQTSDLFVELHEGFGGSQQLQAFKARQEVVSSSLYNRALFSVFPELVPGQIAQARPEQRINAGSNQPQELGSSLAALVPESNQINSSRGARPVSSSSSSRHQESPLRASWTGQYPQPMETTGVQFRISVTKEAKAAAKALKKDKKSKKAKDQTWQDKEVDRKRPRPDGEGDGNGGMC